VLTRK